MVEKTESAPYCGWKKVLLKMDGPGQKFAFCGTQFRLSSQTSWAKV